MRRTIKITRVQTVITTQGFASAPREPTHPVAKSQAASKITVSTRAWVLDNTGHSRAVSSFEPVSTSLPSGENATA
jgi:hypothetical protein